jgi:FkbM family methyltransferase
MRFNKVSRTLLGLCNFHIKRKLNGSTVHIPVTSGLKCGISGEKWMSELLKILLEIQKGTFLDIGVNLGQTLIKLKSIEPGRSYVGIEPNTNCVFYLRKLIKRNQWPNTELIPVGLFNETCLLQLTGNNEYDGQSTVIDEFKPGAKGKTGVSQTVPLLAFDVIQKSLPTDIQLVKIDVEGAEQQVLESIADFISEKHPSIILEVWQHNNQPELVARSKELEALIRRLGYRIYSWNVLDQSPYYEKLVEANLGEFDSDNYLLIHEKKLDILSHFRH